MTYPDGFGLDRGLIEIRDDLGVWTHAVLLHELGHAIGLEHRDDEIGIMNTRTVSGTISERNALDAACSLGCGPC